MNKKPRNIEEVAKRVAVLTNREERLKKLSAFLRARKPEVENEVINHEKVKFGYLAVAEQLLDVGGLVEVKDGIVYDSQGNVAKSQHSMSYRDLEGKTVNRENSYSFDIPPELDSRSNILVRGNSSSSYYVHPDEAKIYGQRGRVSFKDEVVFNLIPANLEKAIQIRSKWLKSPEVVASLEAAEKAKKELALIAEKIKTINQLQRPVREDLNYLEQVLDFSSSPLNVGKNNSTSYDLRDYTLLIGDMPVLRVDRETCYSFVAASSPKKPLVMRAIGEKPSLRELGNKLVNLGLGDFCTADGIKIFGEARENVSEVFSRVQNGEKISPEDFEKRNSDLSKQIINYNDGQTRRRIYSPINPEWLSRAGEEHNKLVAKIIGNPDLVEPGMKIVDSEYQFADGWARADFIFEDARGNLVAAEVKPNANRYKNFGGLYNAIKGGEQTTGYRAAIQHRLKTCPVFAGLGYTPQVRGMLISYDVDEKTKKALLDDGCEFREVKNE